MKAQPSYVHHNEGVTPIVTPVPHDAIQPGQEETYKAGLPDFVRDVVDFNPLVRREVLTTNDTGARVIAGIGQNNGNHQLTTDMPRLIFDVNRDPDQHVDGYGVEGAQMATTHPHGSIWRCTASRDLGDHSDVVDALRRPYTEQEFQRLREMAFEPWINSYRAAMDAAFLQHGFAIAAEVHTFPSNVPGRMKEPEKYRGGYAVGPKMKMGNVSGMEDLMAGKMPGVFAITNFNHAEGRPGSCHPMVLGMVRQEFERAGYPVSNDFGPLQGDHGSTVMYGDPANNRHVVGLEIIDHRITPDKINGSVEHDEEEAQRLAEVMRRIYSRFASLRAEDLAS